MSTVYRRCQLLFTSGDAAVTHEWDDWHCTSYFTFFDRGLASRLAEVSRPGVTGFVLAIAEWVCARLAHEGDALDYVDAAWLQPMGIGRCERVEFDATWAGPTLGPLRYAQLIVANAVFDAQEDGADIARVCWASNLARHVMPPSRMPDFENWLDVCCRRLTHLHPIEMPRPASLFEPYPPPRPVSPATFSHGTDYDPRLADLYASEHAATLFAANRFAS